MKMKNFLSGLTKSYNTSNNDANNPPVPTPPSPEMPMADMAAITKECICCFTDYIKCKEREKTKRKEISARLSAIQYQIDAKKEVYLKILEQNYEERNRLYDMAEKAHKKALEIGDTKMLHECYDFMLKIYKAPYDSNGSMPSLSNGFYDSL